MRWGLDLLGAAKYPKVAAREFPSGFYLGIFLNTFGPAWSAIRRILDTGRCAGVRGHAIWEDNHTYRPERHDRIIMAELERANRLKRDYPTIDVQFSPFCEHNIKGVQLTRLFQNLMDNSDLTLVNSFWKGDRVSGVINEVHGKHPSLSGMYNFSFDGTACVDSDVTAFKEKHKGAETFYLWDFRFNGKWDEKDTTPRPKRTGWPDRKHIRSIVALTKDRGEIKFPKNWIYKSHAENHGPGDVKGEKPVMISPIKTRAIELRRGENLIATLPYYGTFAGGGYRYYARKWGYEIATDVLDVWANGKRVGTVNPAFRAGSFR